MIRRKTFFIVLCLITAFLWTNPMIKAESNNTGNLVGLTESLPAQLQGWQKSAKGEVYTKANLFEYINGGAELYISYDFINLAARTYKKQGDDEVPEIKIDIFDMSSAANAFGVFAHSKEKVDRFIAPDVESEYAAGLLTFWKGRYYVSILAYPETEEKKKLVQTLGRAIATQIKEKSVKPALIDKLPQSSETNNTGGIKLDIESIRYFRHYIWLNSYYFISDKNILNLDKETEAVIAKYKFDAGEKKSTLLLIAEYPDETKARAGSDTFIKSYIPHQKKGLQQRKDGRWSGCIQTGKLVRIVLNAPGKEQARRLLTNSEQ